MTKQSSISLIAFLFFIGFSADLLSQKKVYGLPSKYDPPIDYFDAGPENVRVQLLNNTGNKNSRVPWRVVSDRMNNPVYESPSTTSAKLGAIDFGTEMYFVVDEKDDWIKIIKAKIEKSNSLKCFDPRPVGWVEKNKMLLWNDGLVDLKTSINKKAFLLKRADNIAAVIQKKQSMKDLVVDIYKDPFGTTKGKEIKIYDFYFVMKKEAGMYLLSREAELTAINFKSKLIGWVSAKELQEWNTRISLEPNFSEEAFNERKVNPNVQCAAFRDAYSVPKYIDNGDVSGAVWNSDPVLFSPDQMAKSDPRRTPGDVVRLPMFKKGNVGDKEYYKSGVIGSILVKNENGKFEFSTGDEGIPEMSMAQLKRKVSELEYKNKNLNVFFIVEATDQTYSFQPKIVKALESLKDNTELNEMVKVQYGALLYRDVPEGSRVTEFQPLTPDINKVTSFVGKEGAFSNKTDQDDYTAMFYGIKQGLNVAGFNKEAINLVFVIGNNADFKIDEFRRNEAKSKKRKEYIDNYEGIFQGLANIDAHLYSIQLFNSGLRVSNKYAAYSWKFILESAKFNYNGKKQSVLAKDLLASNGDLNLQEPTMIRPDGAQTDLIGAKPGRILRPLPNKSLTDNELLIGINDMISNSLMNEEIMEKAITDVYGGGELDVKKFTKDGAISVGSFTSEIIDFFQQVSSETGVSSDVIIESTGVKVAVYTEIYVPVKVAAAKHPMFSYVLFMPEKDLVRYRNQIQQNLTEVNFGSPDERREALYNVYIELVGQLAGEDITKNKNKEEFTRGEVMQLMQGVYGEGLTLDIPLDVKIGDIQNNSKVSDDDVNQLIERFKEVKIGLDIIIKKNQHYDFCMSSDNSNNYYWIRLDQVF